MNQSLDYEEALKLPNLLTEFHITPLPLSTTAAPPFHPPLSASHPLVLLGLREHVFTRALSTSALFMSHSEALFGVVWQRVLAAPLRVRLHYGHPDVADKVWMATRGGFSKASAVVNVSEDVFAGARAAWVASVAACDN